MGIPSIPKINRLINYGLDANDLPSLDLQFAADKTLTARRGPTPTFTRASTATFVGSNGLIQTAAINAPRFDHDPVTLASRGLLIEESRTNLSLYSEALVSSIGWTGNVISTVSGSGPNGSAAYELAESTSNVSQTFGNTGGTGGTSVTSITSGTTYTGSIFLKKISGSIDWVQITLGSAGFGLFQYANINLSNGSIGNSSGGTARVEAHANGWYRVSWTVTANSTTTSSLNVALAGIQNTNGTTRTPIYTGSSSNKFLAAMCQFEVGSFPTSYIPTTTASVVRSADVCSITGSDFSGFYNQSEGTFLLKATNLMATATLGNRTFISFTDGSYSNQQALFKATNTNNLNFPIGAAAGPAIAVITIGSSFAVSGAFAASNCAASFNGAAAVTVAGSPSTVVTKLEFRDPTGAPGGHPTMHISQFRYYRKRLPNEKLQSLTT